MAETTDDVVVLGRDEIGTIAESHAMRYYLTECCGASAKGSTAGGEPATVCRACYAVIDDELGGLPDRVEFVAGRIRVVERRPLVESYGDGLPYATWKSRYVGPAALAATEETPCD